jgi:hypothetical protein
VVVLNIRAAKYSALLYTVKSQVLVIGQFVTRPAAQVIRKGSELLCSLLCMEAILAQCLLTFRTVTQILARCIVKFQTGRIGVIALPLVEVVLKLGLGKLSRKQHTEAFVIK